MRDGSPHLARNSRWTKDTLKVGEEIIVTGHLAKDGSLRIKFMKDKSFDKQTAFIFPTWTSCGSIPVSPLLLWRVAEAVRAIRYSPTANN